MPRPSFGQTLYPSGLKARFQVLVHRSIPRPHNAPQKSTALRLGPEMHRRRPSWIRFRFSHRGTRYRTEKKKRRKENAKKGPAGNDNSDTLHHGSFADPTTTMTTKLFGHTGCWDGSPFFRWRRRRLHLRLRWRLQLMQRP